jgi:hypothetical protein
MTRTIIRFIIAGILLIFLASTMVESTMASVLTPGVSMSNDFTYDVVAHWRSNEVNGTIPIDLIELNQTTSIEVRIYNVSDSNITTFTALYYKNGTADSKLGTINIDTGESYDSGAFALIIGANLTANQRIHPLGTDMIFINETVTRSYNGSNRETNRVVITYQNSTDGTTASVDRYFDKITGMLVELEETTTYANPTTTTIVSWKLKDSNVWTVPEFPSMLILSVVVLATTMSIIAYKKKHVLISKI